MAKILKNLLLKSAASAAGATHASGADLTTQVMVEMDHRLWYNAAEATEGIAELGCLSAKIIDTGAETWAADATALTIDAQATTEVGPNGRYAMVDITVDTSALSAGSYLIAFEMGFNDGDDLISVGGINVAETAPSSAVVLVALIVT